PDAPGGKALVDEEARTALGLLVAPDARAEDNANQQCPDGPRPQHVWSERQPQHERRSSQDREVGPPLPPRQPPQRTTAPPPFRITEWRWEMERGGSRPPQAGIRACAEALLIGAAEGEVRADKRQAIEQQAQRQKATLATPDCRTQHEGHDPAQHGAPRPAR